MAKCESKWQNTSWNCKTSVKTAKRESKWQNATQNGKTRVKMAKRESKRQNASRNSKTRVETAKRRLKWQNASRNGKRRVETAKWSHGQPADHLRITWGLSPGCPYSKLQSALMILMKAIPSGKYLSHRIFFAKAMAMTIDLVTFGRVFFRKREERWRWRRRLL